MSTHIRQKNFYHVSKVRNQRTSITGILNPAIFTKTLHLVIIFLPVIILTFTHASPILAEAPPAVDLTADERAWLDSNSGRLTLLFNTDFPPIEFSTETGQFTGMGADVIDMIEKRLGVTFVKVPSEDWNRHLAALESGECAVAPTIVRTEERERYAFFTPPYAVSPVVIITSRAFEGSLTVDGMKGLRVAVVSGYATEKHLTDRAQGRFEVIPVATVVEGLRILSFGQVDAFVENLAVASYYIEKEGIHNLKLAGSTDYSFEWCIGVSRKYPLLYSSIQKALDTIPKSDLEAVRRRYISLDTTGWMTPETRLILKYFNYLFSLVLFILAAVGFILHRRLKEKMAILKRAQKEALEQTELLSLISEAASAGVWDFYPQEGIGYLSDQWYLMFGYTPKKEAIPLDEWKKYLHPEDEPRSSRAFSEYIEKLRKGPFELEFRVLKADGSWCWILAKGKAVAWDEKGVPTRIIGINLDITRIKKAQEEVARSEVKFRSLFEMAPMPLAVTSNDGKILEVNNRFTEVLGYTIEDAPTLEDSRILAYPDPEYRERIKANWMEAIGRAVESGATVETGEIRIVRKDGKERDMVVSVNAIGDRLLVSLFDVTARKQEVAARLESMELLRATLNATTDGILVVNRDGKITQKNRQFLRMWRIPPELQETDDDSSVLSFILEQMKDPEGFQSRVRMLYQSRLEDTDEIHFKDGRVFERHSAPMILEGVEIGRVWDFRDITERKRSEDAVDFERRRLLSVFESLNAVIYVSDPFTYELLFVNRYLRDKIGRDPTGEPCYRALQGLDRPCDFCTNPIILNNGGLPHMWEYHNPVTDTDIDILDRIIRWPDGRDVRLEFAFDITDRKKAEEALKESEDRFRSLFEMAPMPMAVLSLDERVLDVNNLLTQTMGYTVSNTQTLEHWWEIAYPDPDYRSRVRSEWTAAISGALESGLPTDIGEHSVVCMDGKIRDMIITVNIIGDRYLVSLFDITDRKQAEAEVHKLASVVMHSSELVNLANPEGKMIYLNDAGMKMLGISPDEVERTHILQVIPEHLMEKVQKEVIPAMMAGVWEGDLEYKNLKSGTLTSVHAIIFLDKDSKTGAPLYFANVSMDITGRKHAEEALRASEEKLKSIFAAMEDLIFILDADSRVVEVAPTNTTLLYRPLDEVMGKYPGEIFPPGKAEELSAAVRGALTTKKPVFLDYELEMGTQKKWFSATVSPFSRDRVIWIARDTTARKQAEEERSKLKDQLLQSQKLEAIGTLAGGVAHDFNNMLGAIIGYAEMTMGAMDPKDPFRKNLARILDAAYRSAGLTRQLLAFARKQTITPVVLDLNRSIEDTLKMLRRLIGENISLIWLPGPGPCTVKMDPSQLDQILTNLCVNAKDAIADIGTVTIETDAAIFDEDYCRSNPGFTPGGYSMIAVSDDGCGMDKDTMDRIFDPFFTTKPLGQGTGMGLATVYGIVKQNEGFIKVYSEPGHGTTFRIYIPRHTVKTEEAKAVAAAEIPSGRGEVILLVEDDPTLLEMSRMMLQRLGYNVIYAASPSEAIRLAEDKSLDIRMFITDVVMPEMNGRDLGRRLQAIRPGIKHLFMSGYTADVIIHKGLLDEGLNFIQKPFSLKDLAERVHKVLG